MSCAQKKSQTITQIADTCSFQKDVSVSFLWILVSVMIYRSEYITFFFLLYCWKPLEIVATTYHKYVTGNLWFGHFFSYRSNQWHFISFFKTKKKKKNIINLTKNKKKRSNRLSLIIRCNLTVELFKFGAVNQRNPLLHNIWI